MRRATLGLCSIFNYQRHQRAERLRQTACPKTDTISTTLTVRKNKSLRGKNVTMICYSSAFIHILSRIQIHFKKHKDAILPRVATTRQIHLDVSSAGGHAAISSGFLLSGCPAKYLVYMRNCGTSLPGYGGGLLKNNRSVAPSMHQGGSQPDQALTIRTVARDAQS